MKVSWRIEKDDSVGVGIIYKEIGKITHDLGETILCEADLVEPNELKIKQVDGEYEPESYTYTNKNGLEVYSWRKL